jgi:rhamnosyltransferase
VRTCVCIPTLNAAGLWNDLWTSLKSQTLQPSEVIILDSSSEDGTAELARRGGCRVVGISRGEFSHGGTRQRGVELAVNADIVVYLTQDAILRDAEALSRLVAAFDDPSVGAAFGRQLPRRDANPIEAHARLFNYPQVSDIRSQESASEMGFRAIFFSNSFGAYRKAALEQAGGFPRESNFGEDTVVAARLLQTGWRIAYVAEAEVYHSHAHSFLEEYRRYYRIGQLHGREQWLLRDFGATSREGRKFVFSEIHYLLRHAPWLIPEALLRSGLKYWGYRRGGRHL